MKMGYTSLGPQVRRPRGFGVLRALGRLGSGLGLMATLSTCEPGHRDDCLKSNGKVVTQRRDVAPGLLTVTAFDNVDLRLVQDTQTYAEVRTGETLLEDIELTRKGNSLEIANTSRCNWTRSYDTPRQVTLHLPRITNVFLRGQGNGSTVGQFRQDTIFFHLVGSGNYDLDLQARQLYLDQYELGDVTVRGNVEELNFILGSTGRLFAQGLTAQRCYFRMTRDSNGDARVRATAAIGGIVAGSGTLYYSGRPTVTQIQITGKGDARPE